MKKEITITFEWWNSVTPQKDITVEHQTTLEEDAIERIEEMRRDGLTSGDLHSSIEENGVEVQYAGFWSMTMKTL